MKVNKTIRFTCKVCGKFQDAAPIAVLANNYSVIKCLYCTLETVEPLPTIEQLIDFYNRYHFTDIDNRDSLKAEEAQKLYNKIIDFLASKINKNEKIRFLDYGFGRGYFLKQLAERGFIASGVEYSDRNCRQLKDYFENKKMAVEIKRAGPNCLEGLSNQPFDCISLFSIIEHLLDPVGLISELSNVLKPGGILYIECPNNDALYLKIKNLIRKQIKRDNYFNSLKPPEHIYAFNRRSMSELLRRANYQPIEINDFPAADRTHQVENIFWYPDLSDLLLKKDYYNLYAWLQYFHKIFDIPAKVFFKRASGLSVLARKL